MGSGMSDSDSIGIAAEEAATMAQDDLKTLERRAFRKFYEDGLFDVFLGLVMAMTSVGDFIDHLGLSDGAALALTIALFGSVTGGMIWLRRRVVRPRLGVFKPGPARRRRIRGVRLVLAASVALGLLGAAVPLLGEPPAGIMEWAPFIFLANSVVVFGLMAYFLDVPRFLLYGFLFPAPMIADFWWGPYGLVGTVVAFGIPAAIIVGIGLFKLSRFLRDYPIREGEASRVC